jgi:hypothetical protein
VRFGSWSHRTRLRGNDLTPDSSAQLDLNPMRRIALKCLQREVRRKEVPVTKFPTTGLHDIEISFARKSIGHESPDLEHSPDVSKTLLHIVIVYTCQDTPPPLKLPSFPSSRHQPYPLSTILRSMLQRLSASLPESGRVTPSPSSQYCTSDSQFPTSPSQEWLQASHALPDRVKREDLDGISTCQEVVGHRHMTHIEKAPGFRFLPFACSQVPFEDSRTKSSGNF